ncbi:protein of unknown function [Blastococcus saxobsidens DD2]|uniref:Uncharacterized protein n=1 Tax=Blastococcus saxobsidens (strain DD2) TaxID=1146883 RepID=H6RMI8_BLASD|nr:protein of unknown function [Blastococcus saxobsidens DD2]
MPRAVTGGAR